MTLWVGCCGEKLREREQRKLNEIDIYCHHISNEGTLLVIIWVIKGDDNDDYICSD